MKKKCFVIEVLIAFVLCSCGVKSTPKDEDNVFKIDTIWNENTTNTFYGASFGCTKDFLINKFKEYGFYETSSTDYEISFINLKNYGFSFGGKNWDSMSVGISQNIFFGILFENPYTDKKLALRDYMDLRKGLLNKYDETSIEFVDDNVFEQTVIFGLNGIILLKCNYTHTDSNTNTGTGEDYYSIQLVYFNNKYYVNPQNEL